MTTQFELCYVFLGLGYGKFDLFASWASCQIRKFSFEVGGGENVSGISGACTTHNFTYLVRGPWCTQFELCYVLLGLSYGIFDLFASWLHHWH